MGRAVTDTKSHHFAYSSAVGPIERNCKSRLQQTPSHTRNRIRKQRCLPLFRCAGRGLSRPHVIAIKSALLRFQYQETLSFSFGSAAAKGRSRREIPRFFTRLRCRSARVNAEKTSQVFMIKKSRHFNVDEVRQRFRLTPTERRVALFVAAAFVLGLTTKCYRDAHPTPTPVQTHLGSSRTPASFRAKTGRVDWTPDTATKPTRNSAEKLNLSDSATQEEHQQK